MKRVFVLGLDGLSWSYVDKMLSSGKTPNLRRFLSKSHKYVLDAYPPCTPPSWSSIMSGVNPGKHGIFGFVYVDRAKWKQRLYTSRDLEHPRIHEMLSIQGVPTITFNSIPEYPLIGMRHANIIVYEGLLAPRNMAYPEPLRRLLNYALSQNKHSNRDLDEQLASIRVIRSLVEDAIDKLEWRLAWFTLPYPDRYLHYFPELLTPTCPESYRRVEEKMFDVIDRILGVLMENSDVGIIVSDHGFKPYYHSIILNDILYKAGYVRITTSSALRPFEHDALTRKDRDEAGDEVNPTLAKYAFRFTRSALLRLPRPIYLAVRRLLKGLYKAVTGKEMKKLEIYPDMLRSEAFMDSHYSFGVYVKNPRNVDSVIEVLRKTGLFLWVKRREQVFRGPYVERAPEVVLLPKEDYVLSPPKMLFSSGLVESPKVIGDHYLHGVLAVRGVDLRGDGAHLPPYVVAPLVMSVMGVPLPHDSDAFEYLDALGIDGYRVFNYLPKWRLLKRLNVLY